MTEETRTLADLTAQAAAALRAAGRPLLAQAVERGTLDLRDLAEHVETLTLLLDAAGHAPHGIDQAAATAAHYRGALERIVQTATIAEGDTTTSRQHLLRQVREIAEEALS